MACMVVEFSCLMSLSAQTASSPAISTRPDENDDGDFLSNQDEADADTDPTNIDSDDDDVQAAGILCLGTQK